MGPLVTPSNLKSLVLSPRTVWLEWTDMSLGRAQKITDGRYYIVAYKTVPDGEEMTVTVKVRAFTEDVSILRAFAHNPNPRLCKPVLNQGKIFTTPFFRSGIA